MTSFSESVSLPPSIISLHRASPVRLQLGSASVISVQVQGQPLPWVSWFIGKNRIQSTNPNFRAEVVGDGRRHNLRVTKVTRDLDEGLAIEARNDAGTDYRRIAIAICQDEQAEDVPRRISSTLASSNGASGCISGFGGDLPVAGRSNYSFTDDVFDELISPGIPPLLLVQQKETIFPDEASREILCPTPDGSSGDPGTTIKEKNLRRKSTGVKPGRHNNETVRSASEGPTVRRAPQEIWKLDGVALDSVCRDLLRDSVPTEDDMDDLVSKNENWKPNRLLDSKDAGKSETEKLGHNERNTSQPSTVLGATVTAPDANVKKTSRLAKLKDRIKKIRRLSSGKKQSNDDKDHSPSTGLHSTADNKALESQTTSKSDETPKSVESPRGKTSTSKKTPRKKNSVGAENGNIAEVIVPYSAESGNSEVFSTVSRISTDKRESSQSQENSKGYTSKNGLVERQNELAGSGDLSHAGYIGPEKTNKYKTLQSKECDSNDIQNENAITNANTKDDSIDLANKKVPQASGSRQIEYKTRGFPPIQLNLKDQNALEPLDSNEIFDENRITLACSSPPADEVERCRHRLSSSLSQEKSSSNRFQQRGKDTDGRTGRRGYSSSDDLDTDNSCGVASPTSPPEQIEGRLKESNDRSSKTAPVDTQVRGWVVEKRTRAGPTPRSRSCQRPSTAERRSWIENARSVEVQVPRRSRSTSRTRWRSLSKEWDLVTVTTTTEETRTLPNAVAAARAKAAVAIADKTTPSADEIKFGSTTTKTTPATTKTAKSTTKAKIEAQETVFEAAKKSPKLRAKQVSMDTRQHTVSSHPDRAIYRTTQYSSVDSNSSDAGKSILKSRSTAGQQEILPSQDSQRKITTPRRSRKDQSEESNGKVSSDKGTNKNLIDTSKRQALKSSSSDVIQMPDLEKPQTKEPNRDAAAYETKAKAESSTAKVKQFGSVKVEDAEFGKAGEMSEAREKDEVITELRNDPERAEFKADMNETNPEMVELRFKVNPDARMVEISREVAEVDVNSEMNEVNQKTHLVEVNHEVNNDKETAESYKKLDEASRKGHSVQVNHEVNRNNADSVELDLELPQVNREKKTVDFSKGEVTELSEAVNKLNDEMIELNTDKTQISSKSVEPSGNTMAAVEPSGKLRRSHLVTQHSLLGLTEEDHGSRGRTQKKSVSLDSEVFEQNAEEVQFNTARTELNDEKAQLNRAMTRLSAEMTELNSDIPERTVSVSSPKLETYEVDIALPKRNSSSSSSSSMVVEGKNEGPGGKSSSSITVGHSFLTPHEKTLQEGHTSFQVSGPKREQSKIASETGKDRQREGKTKNSSVTRISDSVSRASTHADETESSVDGSVFERGEYDIQTGKSLTWTDSDDVFDRLTPVESVTPKVTPEVTHNVRNTDDADMTDSLTQEVTRGQQNEDAMTTVESMTTELMSGISEDDDAADTLESLTPDVMSEVNAAVTEDTKVSRTTRAAVTATGIIKVSIKPDDLLRFSQTITDDNSKQLDRRPESGLSHETTSFEDTTDEDSYAIVDDNWKNSFDTCYTAMDALRAEEADTCEEEETSMAIENTLEYKQVEADTPESTKSKALDSDKDLNNRVSFPDEVTSAANFHSYIVVGRRAETSIVGNDSKRNDPVLQDKRAKDTGTDRHPDFPEAADEQIDVHDYVTYIRSVFGSRSLSSSGEERDADTRNSEEANALTDSAHPLEPAIHRHTTKRPAAKLARNAAIDTQDLNNETSKTVPEKIDDQVEELKSIAEETCADPVEADSESNFPRFAVPEDVPVARAERKISVSSLVLRKPDVRHVTVERRAIGSTASYSTENAGHSDAVETDSKAHRSEFQTEIITPKPLIRSITLPGPFISQTQGDRGARSTNRVTSLVEIVINSLGIENVRASNVQLGRTVERPDRTSLAEINLQLKKNYALEGFHLAKTNRTPLSGIKFQTEKNFVLEGPHLARSVSEIRLKREKNYALEGLHLEIPNSKSLSAIKFQTEKTFVLEGPHLARPNLTSVSEIRLKREKNYVLEGLHLERPNYTSLSEMKFQTEKTFVLEGPHLARPNLTSLSEIKFQREKNYVLEGLHLEIPNSTSLSERKFQTEKTFVLEGPHLARPNLTSVSEIRLQREKNYALEGLHLERPNYTSLSEIKFQSEKTFVLGGPHLARPTLTSLSEIQFQTEKNYTHEGPYLARPPYRTSLSEINLKTGKKSANEGPHLARPPYRTSLSEIKLQTGKNSAIENSHLSKPNRTSLSEIQIQKEKNFALEGPHPVSQKTTAKPTANQTFRTILTIIGQGSKDEASTDKEPETGIAKNKNPDLNYPPNEVASLTVPTRITVPLDLTGSSTTTHETDAYASEQELPIRLYSSTVGETPRDEEDNKVLVRSESVKWNPFRGDKVDNKDDNIYLESFNEISSETRKVMIEDKDTQDYESVADSEEGYDATSLDVNQVNLNNEQSSKTPEDSDRYQENLALSSLMNAADLDVEEVEFQQDVEFHETRYEYESNEIISEMTHEDGIPLNQTTIVTSVESESEIESGEDTNENSWKEESVDMLKDNGEESESYINDTEAFYGNETEETDEKIDELKAEVGSHFDQSMVVTSVETEDESQSGVAGKTIRIEEESEYIHRDEEEDINRYINLTEEHYDNELEEHNETIGEVMLEEDESHFDQVTVLTRVETEGKSESGNADKISWKEEETVTIPAAEEEEAQQEKDIEERHDIRSEDESRFDQVVVITSVETEVKVESAKADKTAWKEKETLDVLKDEEMEKSRCDNVVEEHYDNEIIEELITEDESHFDHAPEVNNVEAESQIESGNSSKTSWIEEEALDTLKDEFIDITEADDDNESTEHHEAICELIAEYVGESSREDEPESGDVETSESAEKTSWEEGEEVDMLADEEERNDYISVIEGHNDKKLIDELIEEDEGHLDQTVIVTCVETKDESKSGNADEISLEEEETVEMPADKEERTNYEEVTDEHQEIRDELIFEDESRFEQWTVVTNVENGEDSKNENVNNISWKEEEAVDILIDEEEEKEEKEEEDLKIDGDITETQDEKEIEEHREISEELIFEDESRFDQWTVITTVETENESEGGNAEDTAWKEEVAVDVVKDEDMEKSRRDNEVTDEWITEDGGFDHTIIITTSVETEGKSESGDAGKTIWTEEESENILNAEETTWKEEVAIDVLKDEEVEKSRSDNAADGHCDNEVTDEWISEDGGFDHTIIITTSVETEGKSENGDAGKTEEESENILRDGEEDMNKYLELTEAHNDNELEEHNETIGEVMLEERESHFDQDTVFTRIETEVESDSERVDMTSWKEEETIDTHTDEVTSGQQILNPESLVADFNDSSEHVEIKENGGALEDTEIDYETTYNLEGGDNNGLQIEYVVETEDLQTSVRPKENSYSEQSAGEYQTIRGTVSNSDYESRSEDVSERIWKLLESQGAKRKESPRTETQSADYLESTSQSLSEKRWQEIELQHKAAEKTLSGTDSQSEDYLESMRQSLSEKRWQEIERIRREASEKALAAAAQGSVNNNAEKGFDYETWHKGFSIRKFQTINATGNAKNPEVDGETTYGSFGDGKFDTISEIETTDSAEKEKHPENTEDNEYESFSTGMHEEGWRTITRNEQPSANTNSKINGDHTDSAGRGESKSDNDYMVTYEYGEMFSVFHHLPCSIETLRESVADNFNSSPTMRRLLTRYPSLRPGTWKWNGQRPSDITAAQDTQLREVQHLETVSVADQFTPQLMTEKFDTV